MKCDVNLNKNTQNEVKILFYWRFRIVKTFFEDNIEKELRQDKDEQDKDVSELIYFFKQEQVVSSKNYARYFFLNIF